MSLKKQAQTLARKTVPIEAKIHEIQELCNLVLTERKINGDIIEFSDAQNQKIIQRALMLIGELQALVEALP